MFYNPVVALDNVIQAWAGQHHSVLLDGFFTAFTTLGGSTMLMALTILCSLLLWSKRELFAALMLDITLLLGWTAMHYLKLFFMRPRPVGEHLVCAVGYSFPSGHAMLSLVFYGFLVYLLYPRVPRSGRWIIISLAGIVVTLVGISRVYLNVHYTSDVLAGYFFGALCLWVCTSLYIRIKPFMAHGENG